MLRHQSWCDDGDFLPPPGDFDGLFIDEIPPPPPGCPPVTDSERLGAMAGKHDRPTIRRIAIDAESKGKGKGKNGKPNPRRKRKTPYPVAVLSPVAIMPVPLPFATSVEYDSDYQWGAIPVGWGGGPIRANLVVTVEVGL